MSNDYDFEIRLEELKRFTTNKYLKCIFLHAPHYTNHGKEHSMALEHNLDKFLTSNNALELNDYENFLIKSAIWLHDIGMLMRVDDEKLEDIRKEHHIRSQNYIDSDYGRELLHLKPIESNIIGFVSFLHRKSEDIRLVNEYFENGKTKVSYSKMNGAIINFTIHVDKLAMLLRLLDTSDRTYLRAYDPEILKLANMPEAAIYHWAHNSISSVDFDKNSIIINSIVPPLEDSVSSNEENTINDLVINDIKKEIDSLEWALSKYKMQPFNVEHKPHRHGRQRMPDEINEEYLNYRSSLQKEAIGYEMRGLEKTITFYRNGHSITDIINDIIVTDEEGISKIMHAFGADESSPPDFKFQNFNLIKEVPISDRYKKQSIFAGILNCYGKNNITLSLLEEKEVIGDPFKYKEFYIEFSPKLNKNTRLKYGVGLSAPNYFILDDPNKNLRSAHFIRVPTGTFKFNIKFEIGLVVKELYFLIHDINNKCLFKNDLDISKKNEPLIILNDTLEGECSYSRELDLYYDSHKFKIDNPQISRLVTIKFKVEKNMDRSV